ncbi:MAG: hypothetical protein OXH66_08900 [Gemmatimonadetes bacterium]|nr:hypothetical protein [Gemmatimonadota bacterium]
MAWIRLIRLELARLIRSGGVAAAALLLLGLGVYAGWQGNRRVQAAEAAASAAETASGGTKRDGTPLYEMV